MSDLSTEVSIGEARPSSPRPRGRLRKIASSTQVLIREARSSSPQPCGRPRINTLSTQVSRVSGMTLSSTPQTVQVRNMEPPPIGETAGNPRPRGRPRQNTLVTKASILSGTITSSALRLSQTVDDMELSDLTQQELPSPRSQNTDNPPPVWYYPLKSVNKILPRKRPGFQENG
jgi:hypothetical protein